MSTRLKNTQRSVLGMTKPAESQIATISATAQDRAVIVEPANDYTSIKENMATFLASLVSYFK